MISAFQTTYLPGYSTVKRTMINRRSFLLGAATGLAGASLQAAPAIHIKRKPILRVLGTDVTMQEDIRQRAATDLGIEIQFEAKGSAGVLQKASRSPDQFDVYEQWSNSIKVLWYANAIQPIEKERIRRWNEMGPLTRIGKLTDDARVGAGDAPHKLLHIQENGELGSEETSQVSFVPYVHNVDSFGYNTSVIEEGVAYSTESWAWLLDPRFHGKVGLVNEPAIGIFDAALAAQAQGLVEIKDVGNMTRSELDNLFDVLVEYKRNGHFAGIWNSVPQSINFMRSGRVAIESMFSPAVSVLNGAGIPVRYAAPKEGYRGWHGVLCLSSQAEGYTKDAAYDYMNWWLDGWAGAYMARQGYYISVQEPVRGHLEPTEWDYWYEGLPASMNLQGADGRTAVHAGEIRTGGSYKERLNNVAVWNTVMDSYEYSLTRWYELLTA